MNILFRHLDDLYINEHSLEKRLKFYEEHYYDNIYNITLDGKYIGYNNYQTEICGKKQDTRPIQVQSKSEDIRNWFEEHPGHYRVPVVEDGILLGEYYDASWTGQILYRKVEDRSIELMQTFKEDIIQKYAHKKIGFLGNQLDYFASIFSNIQPYNGNAKEYDHIIDTRFIPQFRNLLGSNLEKTVSPFELLKPILLEKILTHLKSINVNFIAINGMMKKNMTNVSVEEQSRLKKTIEEILIDEEYVQKFCGYDTASYNILLEHKFDLQQCAKTVFNGIHNILLDHIEADYNIIDGKRHTSDAPSSPNSKIHVFGPCIVMGLCVTDNNTICSFLQRILNKEGANIEVINHGLAYGNDQLNDFLYMMATPLKKGDTVVWFTAFEKNDPFYKRYPEIPIIDAKNCMKNLEDWFLDSAFHCNASANRCFASSIYKELKVKDLNIDGSKAESMLKLQKIDLQINPESILNSNDLKKYKDYLRKNKCDDSIKEKGAVVINSNPCTLGHLFLISEALKIVDFLYVFLVEDSKNSLPYLDREFMLKQALKYNKRVKVLSGGNVMTSERVFPEYFNRNVKPSYINLALTHKVFGCLMNEVLDVRYRFLGEETSDCITKALNEAAKVVLPEFGIKPIYFKRFEIDGICVSAKLVRKLFNGREYAQLARYVPFSSFQRMLELNDDYNIDNIELFFKNRVYSKILNPSNLDNRISKEELSKNQFSYPGKIEKFGCVYNNQNWIIKIAKSKYDRLSLCSEKLSMHLCQQLQIETSHLILVLFNNDLALMSRNWNIDDGAQFFPLAAYFEELLDYQAVGDVKFTYILFKFIVKKKCPEQYEHILLTFWKVAIVDYFICNARSAGNIGFIDDGTIRLSPNYDNSTWLESIRDTRFLSLQFPKLLMDFNLTENSAFYVLRNLDDPFLHIALDEVRKNIDLSDLYNRISSEEESFLFSVINYRYSKLFGK